MQLARYIDEATSRLSDEELVRELRRAEWRAMSSVRTRRELALLAVRRLRHESRRRALRESVVVASSPVAWGDVAAQAC